MAGEASCQPISPGAARLRKIATNASLATVYVVSIQCSRRISVSSAISRLLRRAANKPNLAAKTKDAECCCHPLPDRFATRPEIFSLRQRASMQYGVTHFYSLYMYVFDAYLCTCLIFSIITSDNSHSRK